VKRRADLKGDIGSADALAYLRGILAIAKAAKYKGVLIVIDEAETILRMRTDSRHKSLNGIRPREPVRHRARCRDHPV
jgi:hypothetical protein